MDTMESRKQKGGCKKTDNKSFISTRSTSSKDYGTTFSVHTGPFVEWHLE